MTVLCDQPDCEYQSPTERGISMHKSRTHGLKRKRAAGKRAPRATVDVETDVDEEGGGIEGETISQPILFTADEWHTIRCISFIEGVTCVEWVERELTYVIEAAKQQPMVGRLRNLKLSS